MIYLTREFRFSLAAPDMDLERVGNSWSGWYSSNLVAPYLKLQLTVSGEIQPDTGYLCNVKLLDNVLREFSESQIKSGVANLTYEQLIRNSKTSVAANLPDGVELETISLIVSPTLFYSFHQENSTMICPTKTCASQICLTQQFEFSAAHRLHSETLSDDENVAVFGKCNNPEGHGHNYVVEISVAGSAESTDGQVVNLATLERTVKELVIDRLDHKHLNRDVEEFSQLNPTVENIAVQIWNWLDNRIPETQLSRVRVYETPKTWADYHGPTSN